MKILAIDTSSKNYSLAVLDGTKTVSHVDLFSAGSNESLVKSESNRGRKQKLQQMPGVAASLFTLLENLIQESNFRLQDCDLLAVARGPGGFTGLRAGVVAAKLLAYSLSVPLVAVDTLEVIAWQTFSESPAIRKSGQLQVVFNAQRKQLFVGQFKAVDNNGKTIEPHDQPIEHGSTSPETFTIEASELQLMTRQQWIDQLSSNQWASGAGLVEVLAGDADLPSPIAPESCWFPSAESVGRLAWEKFQRGHTTDLWTLEPLYFRPSYAEEN